MAKKNIKPKWCMVEDCKNSSTSTTNKLFIVVPKLRREAWLEAVGRDPQTQYRSTLYCCEDHFDLPNDVANWLEYSGMKCPMRFKEHVVPHIFPSQPYWKRAASATDLRDVKRVRTVMPAFANRELKAKSYSILKPILVDKCIQVTPDYRNKSIQCQYKGIKMEEASTSHCGIEFIDVNSIDNNDKLLNNSTQTDDDKSNIPFESVNIKTECDPENSEDSNYTTDDCAQHNASVQCTEALFIKTEIDIKEEVVD